MDSSIALILLQDGIVNGSIYALLGMALVLVFVVTRVIFIPQGEFVAFGALTLAMLVDGRVPGTVYLLVLLGCLAFVLELLRAVRTRVWSSLPKSLAGFVVLPLVLLWIATSYAAAGNSLWLNMLLTLVLVISMGPMVYRIVYQPLAEASVLVLLITSVAVHFALMGLALVFFGAEGWRTPAFVNGQVDLGFTTWSAQSLFVVATCAILIVALWLFFGKTLYGRALRATAVNRRGARLMGISTTMSGSLTFTLAVAIGAMSGMLIAPITTVYYDTGFLIGLKGFVGAIIGGLASYPVAAAGSLLVGVLESFSSFWASSYKEVIVFTLIIPVLVWRSFSSRHVDEEE
ncbi:branched-chain amino acid ABC transporter permease [Bordetella holmesii]|uniref:Branched-chain amino acid ABC transporter, permease protein n=1 Tax=Bordetella holmesii CDC-H585-BH TaxID=1331206 RepID=A0A158M1U4_9BORD|nr:branched-chain amino acid ABC transporter permease [Bordetella holmesii]AMD45831.1 ABC transporter permease [Bordetella holmesii H558]AUL35384.1 branched-chain amino acid ABC transporter permease [Bordetella holmesii]KAK79820.1 branched-chain amino acid ABC transporter, permease protein [Bordetella holmesii H620]KAK81046.1 branched-chain amino acid ABC transporter, permease protein [Bordetella holmesii CDC-H572-BH]KAK88734.1 branched-chain amino acid ABC transporter, permease protein [Borde